MKFLSVIFLLGQLALASNFSSDTAQIFAEAKKEKKPILIDFFGVWCPPCNELDETVFSHPSFLEKAKGFKLLKVDADKPESWKIKDRYKVGGYPTIVFTNFKGDELFRIVGYRTLKEFLKAMDLVQKSKGKPFEQACKSKDLEDTWRCAVISSETDDKAMAEKAYKKLEKSLKPGSARYAAARTYFVENAENEDLKRDGYERLLKEMPGSPIAVYWGSEYLGLFKSKETAKPKVELLEKVLQEYPKAMNDPVKEEIGLPDSDLMQMRADILEKLGREEEAKAAWKETAQHLEKLTTELSKDNLARGFTIERIHCLEQAGEVDKALELANNYREKFPQDFTFHFQTAGILKRQKKFEKAIPVAQKAYQYSYGDNKIRAGTLLIQLYATQSNKEDAKKVFEEVRAEIKPEKELKVRTHRYLTKLEEEMKKL